MIASLAALHDVHQLRRDIFEKGRALDSAIEAERDPDLRLN
jgi:hypothetical protein